MALFVRSDLQNRPSNTIEVRPDQVSSFYQILVETWKPTTDIWALTFGSKILGLAAAGSGIYGNMYFRRKLRLKNYGLFSTYLPNALLPFLIVNVAHTTVSFRQKHLTLSAGLCFYKWVFVLIYYYFNMQFVTSDIYLNPLGCSLCKETKAAAIQLTLGLGQPLLLVPVSAFMFATRHFTYRLPSPIQNPRQFFKVVLQLYRPLKVPMTINAGLQVLIAFFITHMEENHFFYLQKAMLKPESRPQITEVLDNVDAWGGILRLILIS